MRAGARVLDFPVRYLVKAKVKTEQKAALLRAIEEKTLGRGSIAGDEYLYDMEQARLDEKETATWVETCFCDPPLAEERPYWEKYFELLSVKDAHSRRNCRHENGTEPWACGECDCTKPALAPAHDHSLIVEGGWPFRLRAGVRA
jgi:hypothetical protein